MSGGRLTGCWGGDLRFGGDAFPESPRRANQSQAPLVVSPVGLILWDANPFNASRCSILLCMEVRFVIYFKLE
ncbi:hypothetical protein CSV71_01675 [Sporosarcina sp. P21c]|nr:hypothetical protein CSV73_16050 [Sporosarcina sp. P1]PIC90795.1 hypothetical protein CSV71_01675 [Sporosarcina sp. P21c]